VILITILFKKHIKIGIDRDKDKNGKLSNIEMITHNNLFLNVIYMLGK